MRLATYNIEWFNALFDDDDGLQLDGGWSARYDVTRRQQGAAIAHVIRAMDADGIMVVEAPDNSRRRDTGRALAQFAQEFDLRQRASIIGFSNDTQQEIAFLYDPDKLTVTHTPLASPEAPQFDAEFTIDLDHDSENDTVVWSKPPLELTLSAPGLPEIALIGVHAKSKAPHGARNAAEATRISIENRRKQLAQCIWLRRRVDQLRAGGQPVMVMGDFNDGPGLDEYEALFGRSGVEVVLGSGAGALFDPHAHMALTQRFATPTTARFWLSREKRFLQALLDYIMVSDDLRDRDPTWRIWHPFEDRDCFIDPTLQKALIDASDHFPVTIEF